MEGVENQYHPVDSFFDRSHFVPSDDRLDSDGFDCRVRNL